MSHPVIPAPVRFDPGPGRFALRPDTTVACTAPAAAPVVERFCAEIRRRTGLRVAPLIGHPEPDGTPVRIQLTAGDEHAVLPAPQGLTPTGDGSLDERYSLVIEAGQVVLDATEPAGVARGLTTLLQLAATADRGDGAVWLQGARIADAPRYAWRGLSLDVARAFFTPDEIRRVIDLLALYKLNVLHLHLNDDQAWRLRAGSRRPDGAWYSAADLRALAAYAADRFVTVVPEVDMPGHASALMRMHPELNTGRNSVEFTSPLVHEDRAVWLDPELPATRTLVQEILTEVAGICPGPYLHIGGDEPWGMPAGLYASYVRWARDVVRSVGKRPLGWQESARAGLGPDDIVQYWLSGVALAPSLTAGDRAEFDADLALGRRDVETILAASVPVIVSPQSHCYLDVPYAEPPADPADPAQAERYGRVGLRPVYSPMTVAQSFDWQPAEALGPGRSAQVAGVEAAAWTNTVDDAGDLFFLLLPRLPGVAHKAWSGQQAGGWTEHRDRLAWHARLWAQDGLSYFRAATVDWH
jgi:hexosaminidase